MKAYDIVSRVLKYLAAYAEPGMTTTQLDKIAEGMVLEAGAESVNKGYKPVWAETPYPCVTCICVNEEIAHGIPREDKILKDGDLVSFDLGVKKDGQCGDAALTIGIGNIRTKDKKLLAAAKATLYAGIRQVKAGAKISDIARIMDTVAQIHKFKTSQTFCGHGIGAQMHEAPEIPNSWYQKEESGVLQKGQKICLEPMLTKNDRRGIRLSNGWTWRTIDGERSAFFEHMLEVTETGCNILTDHVNE